MVDNTLTDNSLARPPLTTDAPAHQLHILPLRYWWTSVCMVVLFVGGISGWQYLFQGHVEIPPAVEYNIERLKTPIEGLRIVTIGDSYTRFAFPFDEWLEKIALAKGLSLKYTRFTKNYGKQEHFAVLLPHVLAAKPDFVFLHAGPFVIGSRGPRKTRESFLATFRKGIRNIKRIVLDPKSTKLYIHNSEGGRDYRNNGAERPKIVEEVIELMKERLIVLETKMPEVYEEFFKAAQAQGTRVILLDIGHSKVIKAALPPEFNDQVTSNLAKLEARYPIDVWRFPSNLPITHFADGAHINNKGRQVFIDWFFGRLLDELKKND